MIQKHNHAKAILLALLLVLGMIVSPACALGYEVVAFPWGSQIGNAIAVSNLSVDLSTDGNAFHRVQIDIGTGTKVDFTLWYGNGQSVSGWMEYRNSTDCVGWFPGLACQFSGVSIDSDTHGYSYRGLQEIGRVDIATYGRNWTSNTNFTSGFLVYGTTYGISSGYDTAFYEVAAASDRIIYKIDIASTRPVTVAWNYDTRAKVLEQTSKNVIEAAKEWIALAGQYSSSAIGFIADLFWILKFFFIDNLLLIIALWISVSMAYSAITSPNIWGFYKKFFKTQKALLDFVLSLWATLWSILNYLVQIFVKWL